MGQSTNAILFWGIAYDEDEIDTEALALNHGLDANDFEFDKAYASAVGIKPPTKEYDDASRADYKLYWEEVRSSNQHSKCEVDSYCSADNPTYFSCVTESKTVCYRWYAKPIHSLEVKPEWEANLKAFCDAIGLPWREPKWLLVSYWG